MPQNYRFCLVGFGNVGRSFAELLLKKKEELANRYDLSVTVTGIITGTHGAAIDPDGINLQKALDLVNAGGNLNSLSVQEAPEDTNAFILHCPADFMFETTPVNPHTGQPALAHIKTALQNGMHAITANKGPIVHGYKELTALARENGKRFLFESTVMDGAPTFAMFREVMPGANLHGFFGILNSCTNLLLGMMEEGKTMKEAVEYGRSIGVTETDPSNDIDGWDASIKVAILVTVMMGVPFTPQEVDRTGIRDITPEMIQTAKAEGERWKLVCSAKLEDGRVYARVAPERVGHDSLLYTVNGTSSYLQLQFDMLPGLGILETDTTTETTAYGLLADFLNIVRAH